MHYRQQPQLQPEVFDPIHVVEMVYVCRRSNFDSFQVPNPQLKPKSKATTNNLRSEHQQYLDLNRTVTKIWKAKCNANGNRAPCPDPAIIIRHVTHEQKDWNHPLGID